MTTYGPDQPHKQPHDSASAEALDWDVQLLRDTARRHIGHADVRVVGCLSAAADELADPLHPPALTGIDEHETADLTAVCLAVRSRLLDPSRPGTVAEHLSRGRAARELTDALQQLKVAPHPRPAGATAPAPAIAPATAAAAAARPVAAGTALGAAGVGGPA